MDLIQSHLHTAEETWPQEVMVFNSTKIILTSSFKPKPI